MARITEAQYKPAYELGRSVARGMPRSDAVESLHSDTGLNVGSAADYISFVEALFLGGVSERSVQYDAADYYMSRIQNESDASLKLRACDALGRYVSYYKRANGVEKPKIEGIYRKWCKVLRG